MPAPAILFVCLGNICRSPMAEGAARAAFAAAIGLEARLDSAGTGDWHIGDPPDQRAQAEARRHGVDISGLSGRQVASDDFYHFDLILAADHENLSDLRALRPAKARADLRLMLDMVPGREGQALADPYFGATDGFAGTWADVASVAAALVKAQSAAGSSSSG